MKNQPTPSDEVLTGLVERVTYQNAENGFYPRAILLSAASAARSPASQAPPTVPKPPVIASQAQRIAGEFDRDVVIAAQPKLTNRLNVAFRQFGIKPDLSRREHSRRGSDDYCTGAQVAPYGLDLDPFATPIDALHRRRKLDRQTGSELGQQRANPLTAEGADVALRRSGDIRRGYLVEIFAASEGSQHEFHGRTPVAKVLRQRLRAGDIGPAARSVVDGAIAAHEIRQEILHLPFPRVAPRDAQPLARR